MAGERVLVVEDESIVQLHLRRLLEELDYAVTAVASTAAEALTSAAADPPDLVLMDVRLPGGQDGVEAARELRARHDLPVVFLTGLADEATVARAQDVEAAGYVVKPFDRDDLRATLATALAKHRSLQRARASRDDLAAVLDELGMASALVDETGALAFLSPSAAELLCLEPEDSQGRPWQEAFRFDREVLVRLAAQLRLPRRERSPVSAQLRPADRRHRWLQIEVRDDPSTSGRRILLLHDTSEVHELRRQLGERARFHELVGKSPAMTRIYEEIQQLAQVDWTVLIEGDTGTGKELVARAIHAASPRAQQPFVAVNCAGLSEPLLASQLFGHVKGAFTGAVTDQKGLFTAAAGGTLFLDEIGDLPGPVQAALLRVLEDKEVTRLGETRPRRVDARLLAATHRDLPEEVKRGSFRSDLLYRLRVARVELPPLLDRQEDIPLLATWFLGRASAAAGKQVDRFGHEALRRLVEYDWPGNVRELKSAVEHAVLRCRGEAIEVEDLPHELTAVAAPAPELPRGDEKARILAALDSAGGNRSRAARLLGISRATLYRRLAELGVLIDPFPSQ